MQALTKCCIATVDGPQTPHIHIILEIWQLVWKVWGYITPNNHYTVAIIESEHKGTNSVNTTELA